MVWMIYCLSLETMTTVLPSILSSSLIAGYCLIHNGLQNVTLVRRPAALFEMDGGMKGKSDA